MYNFTADFKRFDDKKQPYSLYVEKNTHLKHGNGYVEDGSYYINCEGGRNMVLTPALQSFTLKSEMCLVTPMLFYISWGIYFGYDVKARAGKLIDMQYHDRQHKFSIVLFDVEREDMKEIARYDFTDVDLGEDLYFPVTFNVSKTNCKINVNGVEASFDGDFPAGLIGFSKVERGGAGFRMKSLTIDSEDDIKSEVLYSGSFVLPKYEGNPNPYTVDLEVIKYENGVKEIVTKMHGGVAYAPKNNPLWKTWASHRDQFEKPYIRFIGDCDESKMYLRHGRLTFVDNVNQNSPSITMVALADPTPTKENPFIKAFSTDDFDSFNYFVFGYDLFKHFRNDLEGARDTECIYDRDGNLVYYGDRLEKDCVFNVRSEKFEMEKLIHKTEFLDKDAAVEHLRLNHYFTGDERVIFNITAMYGEDPTLLTFNAYLANAFFKKIRDVKLNLVSEGKNAFGKNESVFSVNEDNMPQNLYHLVIECYRGEELIEKHVSAFEVFDKNSKTSPIETAGMPYIFVGDGGSPQPNAWDINPDYNIIHYVDGSVGGPPVLDRYRAWELTRNVYRRKQMVWFTQRTVGLDTYHEHMECVKNADYIYYLFPGIEESANYYRYDHFHKSLFQAKKMRIFYNEFVSLHPEYNLESLPIESEGRVNMSYEQYKALEPVFDEWVDFVNPKIDKLFDEQWEEVLKVNPNAKRYSYGPYNVYATRGVGGEVMKYFGHPESVIEKRFSLVQFEDYAFCCNYPLAYSTWGLTTSKLLAPKLEIGPEIYDSFEAGCPDTHVSMPTPPFSESYAPPYQTTSQLYSYLYNSVYRDENGYKYWRDNKFMMYGIYNVEAKARFEETVRSWGKYLENKPKAPKKTVCYLYKFSDKDNEFELESAGQSRTVMQNTCAIAMSYVYVRLSELGIPAGFPTRDLTAISAKEIDVLVIPSSYAMTENDIKNVRRLYNDGVKLIATGDVTGLEDIFGVKEAKKTVKVNKLYRGRKEENIIPFDAEFRYAPNGAEVTLNEGDDKNPVILTTDKTMLINVSLGVVGAENFRRQACSGARENVSALVSEAISESLVSLTTPIVRAYGDAYANIFESENGHDEIMLYQCSDYEKNPHLIKTFINVGDYTDVIAVDDDRRVNKVKKDGRLVCFEVSLRPRETMLFKLIK